MPIESPTARLDRLMDAMPLIAILRGLTLGEADAVVGAIAAAGILIVEVPLNSPEPFETIAHLVKRFGDRLMIGAGTVTSVDAVAQLHDIGCTLCVAPDSNPAVIQAAVACGMAVIPGFATATEAFQAIKAGARHLKLFPAGGREDMLSAIGAVLPAGTRVIAVGGVTPVNIASLRQAGAHAFGTGSDLFKPGRDAAEVARRAQLIVASIKAGQPEAHLLADRGTAIGEAPCIGPDGLVYWVDPLAPALHLADPASGEGGTISLSEAVWSLGWYADNLFGTLDDGFCRIDAKTGAITRLSAVDLGAGCRFNDMTIDAKGGLWTGSMHRGVLAGTGALFHAADPSAAPFRMAGGLGVANGMAFSPDGSMLYVVDTLARTLLAYPVGGAGSRLDEPRIVTDFMNVPGKPDGLAIAPDGSLWVAMWGGGCVQHVDASGALLERAALPAPHVGSVAMHGNSLFVTTARARLSQASLGAWPQSGGLFRIDLK